MVLFMVNARESVGNRTINQRFAPTRRFPGRIAAVQQRRGGPRSDGRRGQRSGSKKETRPAIFAEPHRCRRLFGCARSDARNLCLLQQASSSRENESFGTKMMAVNASTN